MRAAMIGAAMIAFAAQVVQPPPAPVKPGNGVTEPRLISQAAPKYTGEAMRAGVQGSVELEVVVNATGRVGDVRVVKSLDPGLDQEAIDAAKQWRFAPAHDAAGKFVPVLVTIVLDFRLHDEPLKVELHTPMPAALTPDFLRGARLLSAPGLVAPKPTRIAQPEYTERATLLKIEGSVDVDFIIEADGSVTRARILQPFDRLYGLDDRAISAVSQWKFQPAMQDGVPVAVAASVTLVFKVRK